jgi:hypothetical protein
MDVELKIDLEKIVEDIRAEMIDSELMEKYHLSAVELKSVFRNLVHAKVLTLPEVYRRSILSDESIDTDSRRQWPRHRLAFLVPIYAADSPQIRGWLTDITDKGVGTTGIYANVGEAKTYVIGPRRLKDVKEIVFVAECRWQSTEGPGKVPIAGFRITKISQDGLAQLRKFIQLITFGDPE